MTTAELQRRFSECVPDFRVRIEDLAYHADKPVLAVYAMWREYCQTCKDADQSPLLWEFQRWYADQLKEVVR